VPRKRELEPLRPALERAREIALEAVRFTSGLHFPEYEQDYELVALSAPGEYAIDRGRIASSKGLDIDVADYDDHFVEEHIPWSNALHSRLRERGSYLCGPLARYALSADRLSDGARDAAASAGLTPAERNPFRSIVVRSVEMVFAAEEALRLIAAYEEPEAPAVAVEPRAGVGYGCTEAPRGILYHRYELDEEGTILDAKIVPPTSQNQRTIEEDLRGVVERSLQLPEDELTLLCEQTIRNYDPCISCATHFLKLEVERS
jgi:coenzyme F420-reducing hydrogenase alpha subunit